MYLSQGCWWLVSSWYPHSCSSCNTVHSHLTYYSLNSHPASGRVGYCSKGTLGTTTCKAEPVGTCWRKLAYSLGFVLVDLPLLHKEAVNQFYPANQKQELNGLLTRPPKQEAGDSPRSRRRGTNSKQRTPRRLAAAKATGETRPSCVPIIRLHLEVEPTGLSDDSLKQTKGDQVEPRSQEPGKQDQWWQICTWLFGVRNECSTNKCTLCFGVFFLAVLFFQFSSKILLEKF